MANGWDGPSHLLGRKKYKFLGTKYLSIPHNSTLNITGSFSLGFQIQPLPTSSLTYIILTKGHPENLSSGGSIAFESINGFLRVSLCSGSTRVYADTTISILNSNKIRSVVVVWDSVNKILKVYLDAVQQGISITGDFNNIASINTNTSNIEIGKGTGKSPLFGILTDFIYLNRVMTSVEIFDYYETIKYSGAYPSLGTIVFSRYNTSFGRYQLYTMKEDGTDQAQLLTSSTSDYYPKWSPDGSRIIYNTWDFNRYPSSPENEFYNINAAGGDPIYLGGGPYSVYGTWAPDGNVAFQSWGDGSVGGNFSKIVNKDTGAVIRYYSSAQNGNFNGLANFMDFALTSNYFVFFRNDGYLFKVTVNPDLSFNNIQTIDYVANSGFNLNIRDPRVSLDGTKITYSKRANTSSFYQIYVMNSTGGDLHPITAGSYNSMHSSFSPDGSKILFSNDSTGTMQLYVCNVDGSNVIPISNSGQSDQFGHWKA